MKTPTIISALSLLPLIASAAPIPGLFNTGVDASGVLLPDNGAVDPHYELITSPDAAFPGPDAVTLNGPNLFPVPPWAAEGPDSRWIAPQPDSANALPGEYRYRTTFDLTGFDESSARITGEWGVDDGGPDILLNGVSTGNGPNGGFVTLTSFTIESGFVAGENTLEFIVTNGGKAANPTGLRVNMFGTVDVPGEPPSILTPPSGIQVFAGDAFDLSVLADGAEPLSYQWQLDGVDIAGATGATYSVAAADASDAGEYTVVVSNAFGMAANDPPATVTVVQSIPGLFRTGVDDSGFLLADGEVDPHYQIAVNAHEESSVAVVQTTVGFPIGTGPWLSSGPDSKWIGPTFDTNGAEGDYVFRVTVDLSGFDPATAFIRGRWASDNDGRDILVNGTSTGNASVGFGSYANFTLASGNFITGINTIEFLVNNAPASNNPVGFRVDEIIGGAVIGGGGGELVILRQPEDMMVRVTENATVSVLADGEPPLSYQWRFNGVDLGGAIGPELILFNFGVANVGDYDVVVSDATESVTSEVASLTILPQPPVIITQPRDTVAALGDDVTISVVADGLAPLAYQWRFEGTDLPGAVAADLVLLGVGPADAGAYDVVITNSDGMVTSDAANLTLLDRVPGIFNTGVDDDGIPLADDLVDPHYLLVANAHDGGADALAMGTIPSPPWVANSATSRWIGPTFDSSGAPGLYTFRMSFDLLGFDPATVVLAGLWSSDNGVPELRLNGVATGQTHGGDFLALADLRIDSGFVEGFNTLEFDVVNAGDAPNPIGLRVENLGVLGVSVGAPRFEITEFVRNDPAQRLEFTFNSVEGTEYAIDLTPNLEQGEWFEATDLTGAPGASTSAAIDFATIRAFFQLAPNDPLPQELFGRIRDVGLEGDPNP